MVQQHESFLRKKRISLPFVFVGFVSLSLLITISIAIVSFTQTQKKSLIDNTLTLNYSNAMQLSQAMDSLFLSMQSSLKYAAHVIGNVNQPLENNDLENKLELIRNSSNYFNSIAVIDKDGMVRGISPTTIGTQGTHITSEEGHKAIALQKPYISEVYTTNTTKRIIVFVSEPIFDPHGEYKGMISGTVYLQENNIINQIFGSQLNKGDNSYFYIVDSSGKLLYHPEKDLIGTDISSTEIVQQLQKGISGKDLYYNLNSVESLAGYTNTPSTDWGVVVVSPTENIYSQLQVHIKVLLLKILLPLLILLLIVIWIARHLARPFVILADSIQKLEEGNIEVPELGSHWNREADVLTRTVITTVRSFQRQHEQLVHEANTDVLTGLTNRRMFEESIQDWVDQSRHFAILVIDIDHFKQINDSYGHQMGDVVLQEVASIIMQQVTPEDVCSRFGGEEFVVLLSNSDLHTAYLKAEQIRMAIEHAKVSTDQSVTVSIGIAVCPFHATVSTELFHLADSALYQAKEEGRNRTVMIQLLDVE